MKTTPLTHAWVQTLKARLAPHGTKAELAEYLSQLYGRTGRSWQAHIQHILSERATPSAEIYLAIQGWLATATNGRQKK